MKLSNLWKEKEVTLSFEAFPPKKDSDFASVAIAVEKIAQLKPDFMSVTYGAGGGTSAYTTQIAQIVQGQGVTALAHLTCVSSDRQRIHHELDALRQAGIENILALRGDYPEGYDPAAPRDYRYARDLVEEPFAIINADDYYGVSAFATILQELLALPPVGQGTMVGYRLKNTVSDNGTVSRGVCQLKNGKLEKVKETLKIKKYPDGAIVDAADPAQEVPLDPESVVSMNFWGFTPWIFEEMDRYFREFLQGLSPEEEKAECLLPVLVDRLITAGQMTVSVLHTDAVWFGVTYQEDRPVVEQALKSLHDQGVYPPSLKE